MKRILTLLFAFILAFNFVGDKVSTGATKTQIRHIETASKIFIDRYEETGIYPCVGLGIFFGESGAMTAGNGRPYGMNGRRYYDIEESTNAFINLIRYSGIYGNAYKQDNWYSQLYAIAKTYYGGNTQWYVDYISGLIWDNSLTKYNKIAHTKLKKKKAKAKRAKKLKERKMAQKKPFVVKYNPVVPQGNILTHKGVIPGGVVLIEWEESYRYQWCEVLNTLDGKDNVIYTSDRELAQKHSLVNVVEVVEGAVG